MEPLVLVHGDDPYLVSTCALRIRTQLSQEIVADLGLEEFRAPRDLDAVVRSLETPPFLAVRRVVVIWDPLQGVAGPALAKQAERLAGAVAGRLETTAVLIANRGTLPATSALLREVRAQQGEIRQMRRPKGRELRAYVDEAVRALKLRLGAPVRSRLLEVAAQDLGRFHHELEKLDLFTLGGGISDAQGLLLVPPAPPTELYRLTDALFESPATVGARLQEISGRPDLAAPVVVGALARVFRELIAYGDDRSPTQPEWRAERLRAHLGRAGAPRLRRWLVRLADLDWATRTGAVDAQEGLELALAGMASELASAPAGRPG